MSQMICVLYRREISRRIHKSIHQNDSKTEIINSTTDNISSPQKSKKIFIEMVENGFVHPKHTIAQMFMCYLLKKTN